MIEEKLTIDFEEYLSYFDDNGEVRDVANAQCCIDAINKVINDFVTGATTVAHLGFNLHGKCFHAKAMISESDDGDDLVLLNISDTFGATAEYIFNASQKLMMTKTNNKVVIDSDY